MIEECILKKMEFKTILAESAKLPIVKNDRELFVRKELRGRYSQEIAEKEIQYNPTYAGINVEDIDKIAKSTIAAATKTITALFTVAGVGQNPGYIQGSERNSYYYQIESQYRREKYQNLCFEIIRIFEDNKNSYS